MPPVPAGPPTFHFRARLLDADGKPFGEREYMIVWGKERVLGWTTPDGDVEEPLQGNIEKGVLHLGETFTDGVFEAYISIPIVKVPEYPPPPEPLELKLPAPPTPPASPVPPQNSESAAEVDRYNRELARWEQYQRELERNRRRQEQLERELQKYEQEMLETQRRAEGAGPMPKPPSRPSTSDPDPNWQQRVDAVNQARREMYEVYRLQYELFWRLRNLGYVTVEFRGAANFRMRGGDISRNALEDACRRYAHKHQLAVPDRSDFSGHPIPSVFVDLAEHVRIVHDAKQGVFTPFP